MIYGRKSGAALMLEVIQPAKPNGYSVVGVISRGFFSSHDRINPASFRPLLDRGYTVVAVVHGSQPKFTIQEIAGDPHRAIRLIGHHAKEYGVNPDKLGSMGASEGGHLSLTMGTHGPPGGADAKNPVYRDCSPLVSESNAASLRDELETCPPSVPARMSSCRPATAAGPAHPLRT